jgi:hypothetical protein
MTCIRNVAVNTVTIGTIGFARNVNCEDWVSEPLMLPLDVLVTRIRGEYREMPGLRLTAAQACRLWQVDAATCEAVLQTLVAEGFLARMANGMFMALPTPSAAASTRVKAERRDAAPRQRRTAWQVLISTAVFGR